MEYAWRIRHRDMVHYYALARRLCNGLPVQDGRPEFYMFRKDAAPVWQTGEPLSDAEVRERFQETIEALRADDDPTVAYSRLFEHVTPEGEDAGASRILARPEEAVAQFRGMLTGWLVPRGPQRVALGVTPTARRVVLTVFRSDDEVLFRQEFRPRDPAGAEEDQKPSPYRVAIELPKAGEYRVRIEGDCELHIPPEAPFVFEASVTHPAWVSYSGPHYFYVPRGTKELIVDASPRLSLQVPGQKQRLDVLPSGRQEGKRYAVIKVPQGADGRVWHTTAMTRGQVSLLNVPPLLSFHRGTVLVPREVAESDRLVTKP
jgi:hypothetical protein